LTKRSRRFFSEKEEKEEEEKAEACERTELQRLRNTDSIRTISLKRGKGKGGKKEKGSTSRKIREEGGKGAVPSSPYREGGSTVSPSPSPFRREGGCVPDEGRKYSGQRKDTTY